ncbi:adenine-specific DNA methylase [Mycobacteroides chelonae]|nr:adenine-specific DNA methylase [Mycobacteroides chelonae]
MRERAAGSIVDTVSIERRSLPVSLGRVAEHESWRKELHRPATYVHKWWARRLGSVFRELLRRSVVDSKAPAPLQEMIVYDPFAGSGTTLVEAVKLGARVVGRDINPIATLTQRQALQSWDVPTLKGMFDEVQTRCRSEIDALHVAVDGAPVLHYFWVATARCAACDDEVELFSNYIFAKHAYPRRVPQAQATCPCCHAICPVRLDRDSKGYCKSCKASFCFDGPMQTGSGSGRYFRCSRGHRNAVIEVLDGVPPPRRMYAKVVRTSDGGREYRAIDEFDIRLYERASKLLANADQQLLVAPDGLLQEGTNTAQALRWGYRTWGSFFNDRQLYCLGIIAAAIKDIPSGGAEREAIAAAFGRTLEHHNLFCSFKGEGTGPVRSIFHNHVLRPERCSVEGNPWGASGGSGGFADALSRLLRAQRYKDEPTDFVERGNNKVEAVPAQSRPIKQRIVSSWAEFEADRHSAYVVTGDGGTTDMPDKSVSLVVTDPPYVDSVHYSELADFFHAWMAPIRPYSTYSQAATTRDENEVQNTSPIEFRRMASRVWRECFRVLRNDGLVVFSFHQSRSMGWQALMASLHDARLAVTAIRPVVAEVTTSLTKAAAATPNRIDIIVVCRKSDQVKLEARSPAQARASVLQQLRTLHHGGLTLGHGDVLSAVRAAVLAQGTRTAKPNWEALRENADSEAEVAIESWQATV